MQDGALRQQRRIVVVVDVLLHPVVVVTDTVQCLDVVPPDGLETHADAGRVQVRLERHDLRMLPQHVVGVQLLAGLLRQQVDVDAVPQAGAGPRDRRLVVARMELERELEVRGGVAPVGVQVPRAEIERRPRGQQPARLGRKDVGVAAHLVNRPAGGGPAVEPLVRHRRVGHVVKHIPAAHRVAGRVRRDVVELTHLDRRDVSIFGETGGHQAERGPLVGRGGRHVHCGRGQDEVGLADVPGVHVREIE